MARSDAGCPGAAPRDPPPGLRGGRAGPALPAAVLYPPPQPPRHTGEQQATPSGSTARQQAGGQLTGGGPGGGGGCQGVDFGLVFRTFGRDLQHVADELNAWCDGTHPVFPPPNQPQQEEEARRRAASITTHSLLCCGLLSGMMMVHGPAADHPSPLLLLLCCAGRGWRAGGAAPPGGPSSPSGLSAGPAGAAVALCLPAAHPPRASPARLQPRLPRLSLLLDRWSRSSAMPGQGLRLHARGPHGRSRRLAHHRHTGEPASQRGREG